MHSEDSFLRTQRPATTAGAQWLRT